VGTAFSRPNHKLINHQFPTKENPAIVAINLNAAWALLLNAGLGALGLLGWRRKKAAAG